MNRTCNYCKILNIYNDLENLQCVKCGLFVHLKCLKMGSVPGGLIGDVFFDFICVDCSSNNLEHFERQSISWLHVILLTLNHLKATSLAISRDGYFHSKIHIAGFIDKNWNVFFRNSSNRGKTWIEAVLNTLYEFHLCCFKSGMEVFDEKGWWTLMFPSLTPQTIMQLVLELVNEYQNKEIQLTIEEKEILKQSLLVKSLGSNKELKRHIQSSDDDLNNSKKLKVNEKNGASSTTMVFHRMDNFSCHFNITMRNLNRVAKLSMKERLMGGVQQDLIFSPYSNRFLPPYIYRFTKLNPTWLRLMEEIQLKVHGADWKLPSRGPLDFVYVQKEHIPAINSLCSQFFWNGIDVSDVLEYPEFSCVVLYRKLIIAFALLTPDVNINESYLSFIFTRPGWRNQGIANVMLYHLTQMNAGRDITLHVSKNSRALLLYNKFCFKIEHVVLDFYDKYMRGDTSESKHAYFCRLTR